MSEYIKPKCDDIVQEVLIKQKHNKSLYHPSYCAGIIKHMAEGYSFESYAGVICVSLSTLRKWSKTLPEFSASVEEAVSVGLFFWERQLIQGATGETKANAKLMMFKLKNAFPDLYKEKTEVEHKNVAPAQIIFNTGIVRDHDQIKQADAKVIDRPSLAIDNGEDLL